MNRSRGSALIEMALGLVVLAPLAVGLAQWGATAYVLGEMQTAVSQGAQFASTERLPFAAPAGEFEQRVRNVVVYGDPEGGEHPRIPGLTPGQVSVTIARELGVPRSIEVRIAAYEAPGGMVRLETGPHASFPYHGPLDGN